MSGTQASDFDAVVYRPPNAWRTSHRSRRFISLADRCHGWETDLDILRRSVALLLRGQDERGSFYPDETYRQGDKIDDQLGGAAMLAYFLSVTGSDSGAEAALERAVRFHLDHLVWQSPFWPFRYSRGVLDRDADDWCNNLWCLWGGALVLRHEAGRLSRKTAAELKELMGETWRYLSTYPLRDENTCHNQLLAYCDIGVLFARTIQDEAIVRGIVDYYRHSLRRLRVRDRGHWIYAEFNQWDAHYGLLSWMALEHLFAATGDPAFGDDAEEMALAFNERVSAGGYYWGGSRNNEGGTDEFLHVPASRAVDLDLNRLLLPAPSDQWRRLALDGHWGRALVSRMAEPLLRRSSRLTAAATSWHFRRGDVSVCLRDDFQLHHLSSSGLELIPAAGMPIGSGLVWSWAGDWKADPFHVSLPPASEGHRYADGRAIEIPGGTGLASMRRGYHWEVRQWWLGTDAGLLWVVQAFSHGSPPDDGLRFVLGTPVLTRTGGEPHPVTRLETAEGQEADTQAGAVKAETRSFLRFGDAIVGSTLPLEFLRPSADAFHTFPLPPGQLWRDCALSNVVTVRLREKGCTECRDSVFFAVAVGSAIPSWEEEGGAHHWKVRTRAGSFEARRDRGQWHYEFVRDAERVSLPSAGFGLRGAEAVQSGEKRIDKIS